ncbi:MAG: histidine ammonia-lyase [Saprospiraceae bacterium]
MIFDKRSTLLDFSDILNGKMGDFLTMNDSCIQDIKRNREYLESKIANPENIIYGINTGFGSLCNIKISDHELADLQHNLVLSHACGMGKMVPYDLCKLILLLKIKNFTKAVSGVRPVLVQRLLDMYNHDIIPVIYEMGSLGASGDLAPLAHMSLPLLGHGKVYFKGKIRESKEAFAEVGLELLNLKAKEGLALLNGTQFSLAYATYCCLQALKIFHLYNEIAALSMEAFACSIAPFEAEIHNIRPHEGQSLTASEIYGLLKNSEIRQLNFSVQDPYSFRCVPQVHGASFQAFKHAKEVVEIELNSATDNPNIFDIEDKILSGGNFHAQPLALILDYMAIGLAELGNISERRVYQLINGERELPSFLIPTPGLHSGFMIVQYTAASIVSQNKQYCTPASIDSIVSSKGQEDHVSMAANAGTKCYKIIENIKMLMAIELLTSCQAFEFRRPLKSSPKLEVLYTRVRKKIPFMTNDRYIHQDLMVCQEIIENLLLEMDTSKL